MALLKRLSRNAKLSGLAHALVAENSGVSRRESDRFLSYGSVFLLKDVGFVAAAAMLAAEARG